jgi:hypothetical protein
MDWPTLNSSRLKRPIKRSAQKKTTDWGLASQSLRRRTDEETIRLFHFLLGYDCTLQYSCQAKIKKTGTRKKFYSD